MSSELSPQTAEVVPFRQKSTDPITTYTESRGERYREYERWEKSETNYLPRSNALHGWVIAFFGLFTVLGVSALGMLSTYLFNPPQYIREAREAQQQLATVQQENHRIKQCVQGN